MARQRSKGGLLTACVGLWMAGLLLLPWHSTFGAPVNSKTAAAAVSAWLRLDPSPLDEPLGRQVKTVETFKDNAGSVLYYVVYLDPSGFVIVPADDLVEPIVAFARQGHFDPSPANPLGALVGNDVPGRVRVARALGAAAPVPKARDKWQRLQQTPPKGPGPAQPKGLSTVSTIWVAPLVQTAWDQSAVFDGIDWMACYNYYTPPGPAANPTNYPCGCTATAMAQLLYYFQWPTAGVGTHSFDIQVDGSHQVASLRGGDGAGGPYAWGNMPLAPSSPIVAQCQAVGALTYDAGVAAHMQYAALGSGAYLSDARTALVNTFMYGNAILGGSDSDHNIGAGLIGMVNPNLDARLPVLFGISGYDTSNGSYTGHAIVCDGYGYNASTLYHHLNLGWGGLATAWYALPNIDVGLFNFTNVHACIYNVYPKGSGEIISGRVVNPNNMPISGATVTASRSGGSNYTTTTDTNGIYALLHVPANSQYALEVTRAGYYSATGNCSTGTSANYGLSSGNFWGANFALVGFYTYITNHGTITITRYYGSGGAVTIPGTINGLQVTSIGGDAFQDCTSLTSVAIPASVTNIGTYAFSGCTSLTNVAIPASVTSIGSYAFVNCTSLTSVAIPASVTSIGEAAFSACSSLSAITVDTLNSVYSSLAGVLFNQSQTTLIQYPGGKAGSYAIPNSVTSIGDYAFQYCTGLTSVTIPNSVTSIGTSAFVECASLTSITVDTLNSVYSSGAGVLFDRSQTTLMQYPGGKAGAYTIPNGVTSIGDYAFQCCAGLTGVAIPNSVTNIGNRAFYDCTSLTGVTIPNSVTSIGYRAFDNCASLTSITVDTLNAVYRSIAGVLFNQSQTTLIQYPGGKAGSYTIPNSVTSIGNSAFSYCSGLTSVTIPDSVTFMGMEAFESCTGLTNVTIGNSLAFIWDGAFDFCTRLTAVYFNGNAPLLDSEVFYGDDHAIVYYVPGTTGWGLTFGGRPTAVGYPPVPYTCTINNSTITITGYTGPGGAETIPGTIHGLPVTSIGYDAFADCTNLTSVTIPNSVTSIAAYAFYDCTSLTNVTIGNSLISIGYDAFGNCTSLTSVTLPNSVTSIGDYAFCACTSLASVTIGNGVTQIGDWAFCNCPSLISITVDPLNSVYSSVAGVLFNQTQTTLVLYPGGKAGAYTIPTSVTSIATYAFYDCTNLTSVTIPNSVTSIGDEAFSFCTSLASVTIPNSVTHIGDWAFSDCISLAAITVDPLNSVYSSVAGVLFNQSQTTLIQYPGGRAGAYTIPNSVTSIGYGAFADCSSLTSVTIPNSLTNIGDYAFWDCTGLTNVTIGNSVASIGDDAFDSCTSLTSVTIPNSVTHIGDGAFYDCTSLTNVTIGDSLTSIGDDAFGCCTSLASVTIPNSVTSIGDYAFWDCTGLTNVTIGNSLTSIGDGAFASCTNLTAVYFNSNAPSLGADVFDGDNHATSYHFPWTTGWGSPFGGRPAAPWSPYTYTTNNGTITITQYTGPGGTVVILPDTIYGLPVTSIGDAAFCGCHSLTSVTIPNSVTSIGTDAFSSCSLTSVTIPNSVTNIGDRAFAFCRSLASVTIPNSVTNIGFSAFFDCTSLAAITVDPLNSVYSSVAGVLFDRSQTTLIQYPGGKAGAYTIPNSVTTIGDWAFSFCSSLTSVAIPNSVTTIGDYAFSSCTSLASVAIPNSVTHIGDWAFDGCSSLAAISVDPLNAVYSSAAGVLFNQSQTTLIEYPEGKAGPYTIPNGVTSIGGVAFSWCASLTSVTIPNSVTNIGGGAFYVCTGLTNVTIGNSVTSIGAYAFSWCTNLTSVTIPNGVTNIGDYAFSYCTTLTAVYFNGNAPWIGLYVFDGDGQATAYHFPWTTGWGPTFGDRPTAPWSPYTYTTNNGTITITRYTGPGGTVVTLPDTIYGLPVTSIGDYAFGQCTNLTSVTIPNSVTNIGDGAFYFCSSLTSVTIGNSITSIRDYAFYGCNLASVTIPNSVTTIGDYAFSDCTSLTSVTIGNSVTSLGNHAFDFCTSLTSVTIGNSVTSIGNYVFYYCLSLASVTIPNSVTSIGNYAFYGCNLTSVTIPNSVTNIGDYAFYFCMHLTAVFFQGNAPSADPSVFTGDDNAIVYYLPGTSGWSTTYGGCPTALWRPQVLTRDARFGVRTNRFGFTITWASGRVVVVEACTNLFNPIWSPVRTNTLSGDSLYFSDPQWTNYPARFYRLRSP